MECFQKVKNPGDVRTRNQLGINTWEFCVLYCLSQRGRRIVFMLSVRRHDRSCPTGLFLWIKTIRGQFSTRRLWKISFRLPLLCVAQSQSCPVFMHRMDAAARNTSSPRACAQPAVQSKATSSGGQRHPCVGASAVASDGTAANCPHHLLDPHVLVGCLPSFTPYWTLTVSPVTAEPLWSSQSSTAGNDLAESPCSLPSGVLLTSDLLAVCLCRFLNKLMNSKY